MGVIRMNFFSPTLFLQTDVTIIMPTIGFSDMVAGRGIDEVYVPGIKHQVLWLLHGGGGCDYDFILNTNIARYAEKHKLAVVMASDYNALYTDDPKGSKYFTYLAEELPKLIYSMFPVSDKREDNFIAGLSMGSTGTFKLAVANPDRYCAAMCMSGCARGPSNPKEGIFHSPVPAFYPGEPQGIDDAWTYVEKQVAEGKQMPKFILTCGSDDDLVYLDYSTSAEHLRKLGLDVFTEEVPGYKHEWEFWDLSLRKAIEQWFPLKHEAIYPEK